MAFQKYVPARQQKTPEASIKRTGTISMDIAFVRQVGLGETHFVTLHFDPQKRLIGIRAADQKEEGAMRLSHRVRVASVRARPLFQAFSITLEETSRVPMTFDEGEGMVVFPVSGGRRRPRGRARKYPLA